MRSRRTSAAGLSAAEVADLLGARVEDVARYEGPVLAEREHIVGQALAVPVLMGGDLEHDALPDLRRRDPREAGRGRRHERAMDQLEGADGLDRQGRVRGIRYRSRRPLGLRSAAKHAVAPQRRRHPAVAAGVAARGPDPPAPRARSVAAQGRLPLRQRRVRPAARPRPRALRRIGASTARHEAGDVAETRSRSPCRTPRSSARRTHRSPVPRPPTCSRPSAGAGASASRCPARSRSPSAPLPGRAVRRAGAGL